MTAPGPTDPDRPRRGGLRAALAVLILPGFLLSFLLALGERHWHHCFIHIKGDAPGLPSIFAPGEFIPVVLETVTPPFSHPLMTLLHFGPFLLFALFLWLGPTRRIRRAMWVSLALFLVTCLLILLPLDMQHECDEAGPQGWLLLYAILPVGLIMALSTRLFIAWRSDDIPPP